MALNQTNKLAWIVENIYKAEKCRCLNDINMERTETLREALIPLYKHLLKSVSSFNNKKATFCLQWGENFPTKDNTGIIFVGRATNGWITSSEDIDVLFDSNDDNIFARSDQMQWVENLEGNRNGYNTKKSAFWRVIKSVAMHFYPHKWTSYIAWSNVCKIAPWDGGNPCDSLYYAQLDDCKKILEKEIEILSPLFVVMLTGKSWSSDFISYLNKGKELKCILSKSWKGYYCSVYKIDNIYYLISEHPQGKPERIHAQCIIDIISNLLW